MLDLGCGSINLAARSLPKRYALCVRILTTSVIRYGHSRGCSDPPLASFAAPRGAAAGAAPAARRSLVSTAMPPRARHASTKATAAAADASSGGGGAGSSPSGARGTGAAAGPPSRQPPVLLRDLGELVIGTVVKRPSASVKTPYVADVQLASGEQVRPPRLLKSDQRARAIAHRPRLTGAVGAFDRTQNRPKPTET
jgi:hypothetical protein